MYDEFRKSIDFQRSIVRALFNSRSIDFKEFTSINDGLDKLKFEIDAEEKKTLKYKWSKFFKGKKK